VALGRPMPPLALSEGEAQQLRSIASFRSLPHSIVQRAQILLACGAGESNTSIASRMLKDALMLPLHFTMVLPLDKKCNYLSRACKIRITLIITRPRQRWFEPIPFCRVGCMMLLGEPATNQRHTKKIQTTIDFSDEKEMHCDRLTAITPFLYFRNLILL